MEKSFIHSPSTSFYANYIHQQPMIPIVSMIVCEVLPRARKCPLDREFWSFETSCPLTRLLASPCVSSVVHASIVGSARLGCMRAFFAHASFKEKYLSHLSSSHSF